eukprot:SAG31_NODE_23546_length_502_cov_0.751861_2_plen_29_part_01
MLLNLVCARTSTVGTRMSILKFSTRTAGT